MGAKAGAAVTAARRTVEPGELLRLADLSLADYLRHLARWGGSVLEEDGLLCFAGAHPQPNPYRNGVLRLEGRLDGDEVVRRGRNFFSGRAASFALWVREHADADLEARARGQSWRELERLPGLVLDRLPPELPAPEGVEVRRVADAASRLAYLDVVANAWGFASLPGEVAARVFFEPDSLDAPNVAAFVASHRGTPLSGAMVFVTRGVALGCQAATVRRVPPGTPLPPPAGEGARGLADSCLWAALRVGFEELGASLSLCQTSALGEPAWRALGYRPLTAYARYLVPARP